MRAQTCLRSHTWHDVLVNDLHVLVAVGARVLVPEADDVPQLVHHDAELVTVFADGDGLGPIASLAHVGTTAATKSVVFGNAT